MQEDKRNRSYANEQDQHRNRGEEHPQRPEPDTMEGPGGRNEAEGVEDARDKATRRGER